MEIRKIENKLEIQKALELIWETFLRFEAPDYSEEGIKSFKDFIDDEAMVNTLEFFGAYENGMLRGVIATNENRKSFTDRVQAGSCGSMCWKTADTGFLL